MRLRTLISGMAIALGTVASSQISTLTAKMHVDNEFEAFLSTSPTELGTQFASGTNWNQLAGGSIGISSPGIYWLHIRARDVGLPAMIIGQFELTGTTSVFTKSGTSRLTTNISNFTGWTGSGPGVTPANLIDLGLNGQGTYPWGFFSGAGADSRFIWGRDAQGDLTGPNRVLYISTQINVHTYSFDLNKAEVAGQNTVMGIVTLEAPSTKSTPFTITSSSSLVTVPPKVSVVAGQVVRNFMMTVVPVTVPVMTVISAKTGSIVKSQGLLLTPLVPTAMAFTPSQVTGGTDVSCRLVVNGVAGPGGRIISVFDTSTYATTPNSVTVPPGATQVVFLIGTKPVTSVQTVSVTARVSAGERTGTFRIYPAVQ